MPLNSKAKILKDEMRIVPDSIGEIRAMRDEIDALGDDIEFGFPDLTKESSSERSEIFNCVCKQRNRNFDYIKGTELTITQRRIMVYRYISGMSWSSIRAKMKKSRQHIFRQHNAALEKISKTMK